MPNHEDPSMDRDGERLQGGVKEVAENGLKTLAELSHLIGKKKTVKIEMSEGPLKDIHNVAELLKKNPQASPKEIRDTILNGPAIQNQKKIGFGSTKEEAVNTLMGYEKMIAKKAAIQVMDEGMKKSYGQGYLQEYRELKAETARSRSQRHSPKHKPKQGPGQGPKQGPKPGPSY